LIVIRLIHLHRNLDAQSLTVGTSPSWAVERKRARFRIRIAYIAGRAGESFREKNFLGLPSRLNVEKKKAVAQLEAQLHRVGHPGAEALRASLNDQAVDEHLEIMLLVPI